MVGLEGLEGISGPFCGGALINDRYVLTAAHCLQKITAKELTVILGTHDVDDVGQRVGVERILNHPDYKNVSWYDDHLYKVFLNDVALLRLSETVKFSKKISSICLPDPVIGDPKLERNFDLFVAGWGATEASGNLKSRSKVLMEVYIEKKPQDTCTDFYGPWQMQDTNFCAGLTEKDSCQGDSGGPLMTRADGRIYALGIVSMGKPGSCGATYGPGVYTRVYSFLDWITKNSNDANHCFQPVIEDFE